MHKGLFAHGTIKPELTFQSKRKKSAVFRGQAGVGRGTVAFAAMSSGER